MSLETITAQDRLSAAPGVFNCYAHTRLKSITDFEDDHVLITHADIMMTARLDESGDDMAWRVEATTDMDSHQAKSHFTAPVTNTELKLLVARNEWELAMRDAGLVL